MQMHKIILGIVKNLFAFIGGGIAGLLATLIFAEPILKFAIKKDVGLGIIAVAPAVLVIYAIVLAVVGGVLGIIVYNVVRWLRRKHSKSRATK